MTGGAMSKMDDALPLLTEAELVDVPDVWGPTWSQELAYCEAQRAKDLRSIAAWLRAFESRLMWPEDRIAVERGHGLEMAAAVLERFLEGR